MSKRHQHRPISQALSDKMGMRRAADAVPLSGGIPTPEKKERGENSENSFRLCCCHQNHHNNRGVSGVT